MQGRFSAGLVGTLASAAVVATTMVGVAGLASAKAVHRQGPVSGGTVVAALPSQTNLTWYFPFVNTSQDSLYNFQLINEVYKPLVWINNKYQIDYQESVADKITYNAAGTVYHVFLNPKWKWSNGQPVNTQDILFSWAVLKATDLSNAAPWPNVLNGSGDMPSGVQSLVANGSYEFTITLKSPANQEWYIYNGLSQLTPLPLTWDKYPSNIAQEIKYLGANATNPSFDSVVDGPFMLQSATPNQEWVLVRNANYSGHKAYLDKFIFQYEASDEAEFAGLKTGTIQLGYVPFSDYAAIPELTGDQTFVAYGFAYFDTELNFHSNAPGGMGPVFSSLPVRQALQLAVNYNEINTAIYHGDALPMDGPIPTNPATPYLSPDLKNDPYAYNPTRAKQVLASAGWTLKNGVMTNAKGQQLAFTLMYSSGDTAGTGTVELMQQDWKAVGIDVTLKPEPFATMLGLMAKPNDWQAATDQGIIYGGSYPSGEALFQTGAGLNDEGWNDATENQLITASIKPYATQAASLQAFYAYEDYTAKQLVTLWANNFGTIDAVAKTVHNVQQYANALTGYPQLEYFWVSPS